MNANRSYRRIALYWGLSAVSFASPLAWSEVVFDGSVGSLPAGTARSGNFVIGEADGQLNASNLFHSFERLNVNAGESALFTHASDGVQNIIGRVSGDSATQIQGSVGIAQAQGGSFAPTAATLWLINPNGLVISDGAFFDPAGAYRLSSANEITFANGDAFFSHDVTSNSTLSLASPVAFGFLAGDTLPAAVTPGGITVTHNDPQNTGLPLFLANTTLVGTNADNTTLGLSVQGDINTLIDTRSPFAPADAAQIQALRLGLHALGAGERFSFDSQAPVSASGALSIANANLLVSEFGLLPIDNQLQISGGSVVINNSLVKTDSGLAATALEVSGGQAVGLTNTALRTTTGTAANSGDVRISGGQFFAENSVVTTDVAGTGFAFGDAGDIEITAGSSGVVLSGSSLSASTAGPSSAGAVVVSSLGDVSVAFLSGRRASLASSADMGDAGRVSLSAANKLNLISADLNAVSIEGGASGQLSIDAGELVSANSTLVTTTLGQNAADSPASINIRVLGDAALQGGRVVSSSGAAAPAGAINISAGGDLSLREIALESGSNGTGQAGAVSVSAAETLTLQGASARITTGTGGSSNAGDILLEGRRVNLLDGFSIDTDSISSGSAGSVRIVGGEIFANEGSISTAADISIGGQIELLGDRVALVGQPGRVLALSATSASANADATAGTITLGNPANPADSVVVGRVVIAAIAQEGSGGQINISSDSFLRDNRSVLNVSSLSGAAGDLEINAPQQDISASFDELQVPLLDQTELIRNTCDQNRSERSSLIVAPEGAAASAPDQYFSQAAEGEPATAAQAAAGCAL